MKKILTLCALALALSHSGTLLAEPYPIIRWDFIKIIQSAKIKKEEPCKGSAVSNVITITVVKCNELAAETQKSPRKDEKIVQ
jgi:hypothetical protein